MTENNYWSRFFTNPNWSLSLFFVRLVSFSVNATLIPFPEVNPGWDLCLHLSIQYGPVWEFLPCRLLCQFVAVFIIRYVAKFDNDDFLSKIHLWDAFCSQWPVERKTVPSFLSHSCFTLVFHFSTCVCQYVPLLSFQCLSIAIYFCIYTCL